MAVGAVAVAGLSSCVGVGIVVIAQLRDDAVQSICQVNAAGCCVFLAAGGDCNFGDGFVQAQTSEQPVAEVGASDLAQGWGCFVQVLHGLRGLALLGDHGLDSASKCIVEEAGSQVVWCGLG